MKTDLQEKLVYRYLLGDLPDAEQLALEQAFFADGETFERVWEIENDLVDRYVRGRLSAAEKKEAEGLAQMASVLSILKLGAQVKAAK